MRACIGLGLALLACSDAADPAAAGRPDGVDTGVETDGSDGIDGSDGSDAADGADGSGGTDPACDDLELYAGDLTVRTAAELADFGDRYRGLTGSLVLVDLEGVADLEELDCLAEVGDRLAIYLTSDLQTVSLPRLVQAEEVVVERNEAVSVVALPALRTVGRLTVDVWGGLSRLDLRALEAVEGALTLSGMGGLPELSLPALTAAGELVLRDVGPASSAFSAPALRTVGTLFVDGGQWTDLRAFAGLTSLDTLRVEEATALTSLAGPTTTLTALTLRDLPGLSDLSSLQVPDVTGALDLGELDVVDLTGLERVSGGPELTVRIDRCRTLASLHGLQADPVAALTISWADALTTLDGLTTTTLGDLEIDDAPLLVDLGPVLDLPRIGAVDLSQTGLTALSEVAWVEAESLRLTSNHQLEHVELDALTTLTAHLHLDYDLALETVLAPALETVGGNFEVEDLAALTELSAPALQSVGGDVVFDHTDGSIDLAALRSAGNLYLTDLAPRVFDLSSLTTVAGAVELHRSHGFGAWELTELESVGGLALTVNPGLTGLSLPALTGVGGDLLLQSNHNLTGVSAPALTAVTGDVTVHTSAALATLDLSALESAHRLELDGLDDLLDLSGLESLLQLSGDLHLEDLQGLTDLTGLDALHTVGGELWVEGSDGLVDLSGLEALSSVGAVRVLRSDALASLDGLSGLSTTGSFVAHSLPALTDLSALSGLTATATLDFERCDALERFDGLEGLRTVSSFMDLDDLASLTDVTALHGVTSVGGNLWIRDNPMLATADAEALRDAIGTANIGGSVSITNNGAR